MFCLVYSRPHGSFSVALLLDQFGVVDRRNDHREIGHGQAVLAQEIDANGVIVDHDELLGLCQRAGAHLEGREAADA